MLLRPSVALLASFVAFSPIAVLKVKGQAPLADGLSFQSGSISSTWKWQASGVLAHGWCPDWVGIEDCYYSYLGSTGNLQRMVKARTLDDKASTKEERAFFDEDLDTFFEAIPEQEKNRVKNYFDYVSSKKLDKRVSSRQRNEIYSYPPAASGETWRYTWKSYQDPSTSTNSHFFHSWQILRRDGDGGPVVSVDYINGQVMVIDTVRGCKPCVEYSGGTSGWFGNTVEHTLRVTYGTSGSLSYTAAFSSAPSAPILSYSASGDMGSSASLKVGQYRAYEEGEQSGSLQYVGDLTQAQVA
ncbi:hypothetical protein JCM8547_008543 [Rhodosporidiobolus lusitaniae]